MLCQMFDVPIDLMFHHKLYKAHPMFIKKGVYHEVNSERDSWALSIGYD